MALCGWCDGGDSSIALAGLASGARLAPSFFTRSSSADMSDVKAGSAERRARISMVLFLSHHCCHVALYDMYLIFMTQLKILPFASWCTFWNLKPAILKVHDLYSDVTAGKCKHGYGDAVLFHVEFHVM
jgi:hypothetical protein